MINPEKDYGTYYAQLIIDGKIPASKLTKLAAKRHLKDLERSKSEDYPYMYDYTKANKVIEFIELLPDVSTGKRIPLALFQCFIISMLYGWVSKKTGYRRFKKAYISMARKNGKSSLIAGIALYELLYGAFPQLDRQVYCTANSKDQAKLVYKMIVSQLKKVRNISKSVRKNTKIVQNEIRLDVADSILKPLSRDTDNLDGLNVLLGILDEYHTSNSTEMMEVLESSQTLQKQPLIMIISTAGFKLNGPMYAEEYPYIKKLLNGEVENESYFAICYEQDDVKEIDKPELWIKSNPLLEADGIKDIINQFILKKLTEARQKDNIGPTLVKNFNMWQNASKESYLNGKDWLNCSIAAEPYIFNKDVWIGVDLSRTSDLTAVSWIVPYVDENGENKFYVNSHSFVGTKDGLENKKKRDKIDYEKLEEQGYCSITRKESGIIDYKDVIYFINDLVERYNFNVKGIFYDEWSSPPFITELEDVYTLVPVRQGPKTLSPATKQFRNDVYDKKIHHTDNPLLTIAVNNAIVVEQNDTILIDKKTNRNKIDPLAALLNAFTLAMTEINSTTDYNDFYNSDDFSF